MKASTFKFGDKVFVMIVDNIDKTTKIITPENKVKTFKEEAYARNYLANKELQMNV